ncbi:MAG: hypothetical protein JNJ61_14860 [Anaerolineae bacterium]|nr:hypothetical protein [Anaerolineae bacterium]
MNKSTQKGCSILVTIIGLLASCIGIYGFITGNNTLDGAVEGIEQGVAVEPSLIAFLGGIGLTLVGIAVFKVISLPPRRLAAFLLFTWSSLFGLTTCGFLGWLLHRGIENAYGKDVGYVAAICLIGLFIFSAPIALVGGFMNLRDEGMFD